VGDRLPTDFCPDDDDLDAFSPEAPHDWAAGPEVNEEDLDTADGMPEEVVEMLDDRPMKVIQTFTLTRSSRVFRPPGLLDCSNAPTRVPLTCLQRTKSIANTFKDET
jgi:hypothetical protein